MALDISNIDRKNTKELLLWYLEYYEQLLFEVWNRTRGPQDADLTILSVLLSVSY
jgi:hypothetical protein